MSPTPRRAAGYFNQSHGFVADLMESFGQKFFGGSGDQLAAKLLQDLADVDHPMTVIAHSQRTLIVANAAPYCGLPRASIFVPKSPVLIYFSANAAVRMNGDNAIHPALGRYRQCLFADNESSQMDVRLW